MAPIWKAGDPSILNYYRPISNLSVLETVLESLISELVKQYLDTNNIVCESQPGFHKNHITSTPAMKLGNDMTEAFDNTKCCLALFIDFSAAFNNVDHSIIIKR